jgi:SAM-dependent methyltransferase
VFLYLKQHHEYLFSDEVDLLHIAPEKNLWEMFRKQKNINYMPAGLDMQLASVRMDITKIQENDNHFDMVICNHVLEHIVDDRLAMSELFRVLKKGGYAILQVPISFQNDDTIEDKSIVDPDERRAVFGQSDHVRIYGCDYISRLESVGFSVKAIDFISELTDEQVQKYSLIPEERIFVCRK